MDNEMKAKRLEEMADKFYALLPSCFWAEQKEVTAQRIALLRECAAMLRERDGVRWEDTEGGESCLAVYGGYLLRVDRASDPTYWTVYDGDVLFVKRWRAADVDAAKAAAVAWVDRQEGK
jgi:hypothetical protein